MTFQKWLVSILLITVAGCDNSEKTFMVGTLERDRVEISVESNEPIIAIHVEDGQILNTGDLILEQDPSRLQNLLAQQTALSDQVDARLAELQRGPRQETIREARAQLEASYASAVNAAASQKRAQEIFDRDLSNQQTLDFANTRLKTTLATEKAARESLDRLLNGTTVEEIQQAIAAADTARAGISRIQLDIERLKIYAPVNGMLDKRLYQLGERPNVGATIAIILDSSRTYARIYVPEPLRASVQPGKQLTVHVDGLVNSYSGSVRWVSADASFTPYFALTEHDRSRLSYLAEIDLPDASSLPSGVPLEVDYPTGTQSTD